MAAPLLAATDADHARRLAASILSERRFHSPSVPRPLHGILHAIGSALQSVGRAVARLVDRIGTVVPGGAVTVWVLLALILAGTVVIVARRRGLARPHEQRGHGVAVRDERAADLERAADRAEREGRFGDAVRLRFRAGLTRLSEHGDIELPGSTPNAQLARSLRSSDFDALARRFDEIAYGSAPADPADAEEARRRWRALLAAGDRG